MIFDLDFPAATTVTPPRDREWQRRPRIEADTPIVPRAVAMSVWTEAGAWLDEELPRQWVNRLAARANAIYARNPRFRETLQRSGTAGRDRLWAFTRHWLAAQIKKHRPELHARLPASYNVGGELPERRHARSR
jgi:hypothetical protein